MEQPDCLMRSKNLAVILNENFSPVARMRLFSKGMQVNNRLFQHETPTGDKGCLACGNCIDACPVVREKRRFEFQQNLRTSMSLENIVQEECRRCYKCVRACPQVSSDTKEFSTGFRRAEKFIHATLATLIFTLMGTGIFLYHYKAMIPGWQGVFFGLIHFFAGLAIFTVPILYWIVDKEHFKRLIRNSRKFTAEDKAWFKEFKEWLKHPFSQPLPAWTEFNPYHKAWVCYLCIALPILIVTGFLNFVFLYFADAASLQGLFYRFNTGLHSLVALCTDILIIMHLYFKLLRWLSNNIFDMLKYWWQNKTFNYPFMYAKKEPKAPVADHGHH